MSIKFKKGILGLMAEMHGTNGTNGTMRTQASKHKGAQKSMFFDYHEPIELSYQEGIYAFPGQWPHQSRPQFSHEKNLFAMMDTGMTYEVENYEEAIIEDEIHEMSPADIALQNVQRAESENRRGENNGDNDPGTVQEADLPSTRNSELREEETATIDQPAARDEELLEEEGEDHIVTEEDDFERDLKAILAGQKQFDPSKKKVIPSAQTASRPFPDEKPAVPNAGKKDSPKKEDPYAVFDQLKTQFEKAKTFNLGNVSFENRFEAFDADLDQEEDEPVSDSEIGDDIIGITQPPSSPGGGSPAESKPNNHPVQTEAISPRNYGRQISINDLQTGDLIAGNFSAEDTQARTYVYSGDNTVIDPWQQMSEIPAGELLDRFYSAVVFRKEGAVGELSAFIDELSPGGSGEEDGLQVANREIRILPEVCSRISDISQQKDCHNFSGPVDFGSARVSHISIHPAVHSVMAGKGWLNQAGNDFLPYSGHLKLSNSGNPGTN